MRLGVLVRGPWILPPNTDPRDPWGPQVTAALEIARDDARYRQILADFPAREASATPQPSPSPSDDTAA
jgi:hypothetical protein